jgi:hypothetical protein
VRYVIMLHRVRHGYLTLLDVFRTVISAGTLERMLIEAGRRLADVSFVALDGPTYKEHESLLKPFEFEWNARVERYLAHSNPELESLLTQGIKVGASLYTRKASKAGQRMRFESIHYWYWEHWKFFRNEVKTSIIQGIAVFLSLFETDRDVRRETASTNENGNQNNTLDG